MDRFSLPSALDRKEAAAIERRKRMEEERKQRIFNPRVRILGVDPNALNRQVYERKAQEEEERRRDMQFDMERMRHSLMAAQLENKFEDTRRRINQEIDAYRSSYQRPETRREFDLYDPSGLKKQLPSRINDDDPRCGPSSAQKFAGEDLQGKERLAAQREQQRAWLEQQLDERRAAEEERQRAEHALQEAMLAQDRHVCSLQHIQNECQRKVQAATLRFNKALAAETEARRRAQAAMDEDDKRMELYNAMTGDLLTENPAAAISSLGPHRLIPDRWKGMSAEQLNEIRRDQLRQAMENKVKKEAQSRNESEWENFMLRCDTMATQAQDDLMLKQKQLNERIAGYNQLLSQQQRAQRDYIERVVYANEATPDYFNQFNTSSR